MNRPDRLPAIVLGGDSPIGLTVVRELGEKGVPVHVIARSRRGLALYSHWATTGHIRTGDEAQMVNLLNRIAETHGARYVIGVSEIDLLAVRRAADQGRLPALKVLVPPLAMLRLVNDKLATYKIAREVGIPVPRSWEPRERCERENIPEDLAYPCILKWRDPAAVGRALGAAGLPWLKAEYCYSRDELVAALSRYDPVGRYPIVQTYSPGVGLGHMIFMHEGKALLSFQHLRRAEWPPEGGTSTVCSSLPPSFHPEWLAQSEALLRRIGWEGAAMVEYRYDARTDSRALMEINGRFWGSLPLAYHAGAHFAWLTYAVLGVGELPERMTYRDGILCRYMVPELRRASRILFRRDSIQDKSFTASSWQTFHSFITEFFNPRTRYYVFSWRDPMPFFYDLAFMARKTLASQIQPRLFRTKLRQPIESSD